MGEKRPLGVGASPVHHLGFDWVSMHGCRDYSKTDVMTSMEWLKGGGVFAIPVLVFIPVYVLTDQIWQDYVLLFGTLLIAVVMVPTLLDPRATVPRSTSVPGAIAVFLFIIGFVGLELWLTALANAVSLVFWILVAVYRAP